MLYLGCTCESLETRLNWHKQNKKSQIFKYKNNKPKMRLIVNTPCRDRKELEKIENEYINEYSVKYSDKLLNKRCNPLCKIKITHRVEIENEEQLRIRAGLETIN